MEYVFFACDQNIILYNYNINMIMHRTFYLFFFSITAANVSCFRGRNIICNVRYRWVGGLLYWYLIGSSRFSIQIFSFVRFSDDRGTLYLYVLKKRVRERQNKALSFVQEERANKQYMNKSILITLLVFSWKAKAERLSV